MAGAVPPAATLVSPLDAVAAARLGRMRDAGEDIMECYRVLSNGGLNVVGEVLRGQGTFYEMNHYPDGDVYDATSHAQYYYHAHRGIDGEHGHFHTFLRAKGMADTARPVAYDGDVEWPRGEDALAHLIGISMDPQGFPIALFAVNRWVTGDTWYAAPDVIGMLDRFVIDHAYPSWPTNRWISAMAVLFRQEIEALLRHRDLVVEAWAAARPDVDVYEDRTLEITGQLPVSVDDKLAAVRRALS